MASPPSQRTIWVDLLLYPGHTLPTAAAPVLVALGLAVHDHIFAFLPAFIAFLASWLIHVGGVFMDNYQLITKHPGLREHPELNDALATGTLTRFGLESAILACFVLAALACPYLFKIGGWPVLALGILGTLASLVYAAGPWPVTRYGLADPLFVLMFGVVAEWGIYYIQAAAEAPTADWPTLVRGLPLAVYVLGLPVGALVTGVMVIDDIRDRQFDRAKGWRTGAVVFGLGWSRFEFAAFAVFAYLAPFCFWWGLGLGASVLLPLLTLPLAWRIVHAVWTRERRDDLVPMTPKAAMLSLAYGLLSGLGIALA